MDFRDRIARDWRVTVMGLGHFGGGVEVARWLARHGSEVTVTDLADEETLSESLRALRDEPIAYFHLGGHREEDFRDAQLVVVNPAVRPDSPLLRIARESGARLTTEIALFMALCPAPIIGVTGSNGKSTTAAMTTHILRKAGKRTWLGGNIGESLLKRLEVIAPEDWVVLELSSFQLWHFGPDVAMPRIAVVTGCTPNHLDWHVDYGDYVAAKQRILLGQTRHDSAVLNPHDPEVAGWEPLVRGRLLPLPSLQQVPRLSVRGEHNRINAACAAAAAMGALSEQYGADAKAVCEGLTSFRGLPQRLERCAVVGGRRFYNDSTSTTPESTIAALDALDGPLWLLAGGKDKGVDFGQMMAAVAGKGVVRKARGAAFFGSVRNVLHGWAAADNPEFPCTTTETMDDALRWCWDRSQPGDTVVLSPGCSSTDQFANFRRRGEQFVALVHGLTD